MFLVDYDHTEKPFDFGEKTDGKQLKHQYGERNLKRFTGGPATNRAALFAYPCGNPAGDVGGIFPRRVFTRKKAVFFGKIG